MKVMRFCGVAIGVMSCCLAACAVRAADASTPVKALPQPTGFDWNGAYFGGHVGYARGRVANTLSDPIAVSSSASFGALYGGLHAGYNYVVPSGWLAGVEADLSFPNYLSADDVVWSRTNAAGDVTEQIVEHLKREGVFYRLETYRHRYPHCWRCSTPLVFRLVDEWYISMGPVYDQPREALSREQVDASLRYQIMEVVDGIRWYPSFGYDREIDWLMNMGDWMISKKRYYGLALPIYDCAACGRFEVIGGREELRSRAIAGWDEFEGHTPHRPHVDAVRIACSGCGAPVGRIADVGNPWLDAGIVPFSTLHYREDADYWAKWFPADFVTESFPGQFRNWFYAMLAMSTVLRRERPFKNLFGYATLYAEDGRPMHKSWGNAIEFDEAAERMGVDVMRWLYMSARPDDNILFGWHAADEARRRLLVLWNVYAFFVGQATATGWSPDKSAATVEARSAMDRWILSRSAELSSSVERSLASYDAFSAVRRLETGIDELSTWYLRRTRERFAPDAPTADREAAFDTLHQALLTLLRCAAPIAPFLTDAMYRNLVGSRIVDRSSRGAVVGTKDRPLARAMREGAAPPSIHLLHWPGAETAPWRDAALEASMDRIIRAAELGRSVRSAAAIRTRQPLARARVVLGIAGQDERELRGILAEELNVKEIEAVSDASGLFERRVKVLLPKVGKRLGSSTAAVMAAAREGALSASHFHSSRR